MSEPSVFIKPIERKDISKQSRVCSIKQSKTSPSSDWLGPGTPSATRSTSGTQKAAGSTLHSLSHPSQTPPSNSGSPSIGLCTHRSTHDRPIQSKQSSPLLWQQQQALRAFQRPQALPGFLLAKRWKKRLRASPPQHYDRIEDSLLRVAERTSSAKAEALENRTEETGTTDV